MNDHSNNDRPSVAEIAALTRRLREQAAQGRSVDPGERAAFLADRDALIARITGTNAAADAGADASGELHRHMAQPGRVDPATEGEWWARAESTDPTAEAVTFDATGYYSDAHLAAIAQARAAGDVEQAERLQDAPWTAPPEVELVPEMPEWMREQARRTDAEIADGTFAAGPPDDMARLTDRLDALREQADPDATERRDQLARWHHDDHAAAGLPTDLDGTADEDAQRWDR